MSALSELGVWVETAVEGEYLASYEDAELAQVCSWLGERGLTLEADDCGLCVVAVAGVPL